MSQMMKHRLVIFSLATAFTLIAGCSSENPQSGFNPDTGRHTANWVPAGHKAAASNDVTACTECHGADFLGGISDVSCRTCHINQAPGSFSCTECHATPPGTGAHSAHSFPNLSCFSCHFNTVGTALHNNGTADISLNTIFNAKSGGTLTFNSGVNTCLNISCHGGQTSPTWISGTLDVNTACTSCHVVGTALATPQYNSAYSGEHVKHVNGESIACYTCHDTTALAVNHFTRLDTPTMEGPASATLRTQTEYNGTSCNPSQGGLSGCHSSKTWW